MRVPSHGVLIKQGPYYLGYYIRAPYFRKLPKGFLCLDLAPVDQGCFDGSPFTGLAYLEAPK